MHSSEHTPVFSTQIQKDYDQPQHTPFWALTKSKCYRVLTAQILLHAFYRILWYIHLCLGFFIQCGDISMDLVHSILIAGQYSAVKIYNFFHFIVHVCSKRPLVYLLPGLGKRVYTLSLKHQLSKIVYRWATALALQNSCYIQPCQNLMLSHAFHFSG